MTERFPFPTPEELHEAQMEELKLSLHFAGVGRIQRYDPVHQVADVVPQVRHPVPQPDGTYVFEDLPVLPDVPVIFPRMGKWFIAMSVQPGDRVQLLFNTLSPEDWLYGDGRVVDVADTRRQHLSHAVALIGMNINSEALQHVPLDAPPDNASASFRFGSDLDDGARMSIYGDGCVEITRGDAVAFRVDPGAPVAPPRPVALAPLVDAIVSSLKQHIANWTPVANDGGASLKAHMTSWNPESTASQLVKAV